MTGDFTGDELIRLARNSSADALREALDAGLDVDMRDASGATALMHAALMNRYQSVKTLLEAGADVNAKDSEGAAPLHWAAWGGGVDTMALLLAQGAKLEEKTGEGDTPLMCAAAGSRPAPRYREAVRMLLARGASLAARNDKGETVFDVAARNPALGLMDILQSAAALRHRVERGRATLRQQSLRRRPRPGGPA